MSLVESENVALGGCSDIQPDAGHQMAQGAASWEVRAPPDVQPFPQHLEQREGERERQHRISVGVSHPLGQDFLWACGRYV